MDRELQFGPLMESQFLHMTVFSQPSAELPGHVTAVLDCVSTNHWIYIYQEVRTSPPSVSNNDLGRLQSCLWPREVDIFQREVWTSPAVSVETRAGILSNNRTFVSVIELDTLEEISGQFQVESMVTKAGYFAEKLRRVFLN